MMETEIDLACKAAIDGKFNEVTRLIEINPHLVKEKDKSGRTIFHWSSSKGNIDMIEYLCENYDLDLNEGDESGWTPLMIASSSGWQNIVFYLLCRGVDVNTCNKTKQTSLHYAASKNHLGILNLLIAEGAKLNVLDNIGNSPLHRASAQGHVEIVKALIEKGANIDIANLEGDTPLYLACEEDRHDVINLLYSAKADPFIMNKAKKCPYDVAEPGIKRIFKNK